MPPQAAANEVTHILHRQPRTRLPEAVGGEGPYLIDASGKRYLDASGGAAVSCLGHGHPDVIKAIQHQVATMAYAHTGFFTNRPAEDLASFLTSRAPGDLDYVYFVSGGTEANETAFKLARQYAVEIGQTKRHKIIARLQSYHGNTLGALSVGGNLGRRKAFEPMLLNTSHIDPCFSYRLKHEGESEEDYGRRAADALEEEILRQGPEVVLAFVAETVVGASLGCVPPSPGYLKRIREICDQYGVLLILDEVMSGMGRTGHLFACAEDGVVPDLLTCAKGLGGGYQPIGATLMSARIYDALVAGAGFEHGFTYIGHATATAAALAVQQVIERDDLLANVQRQGQALDSLLRERLGQHPHVGDIRGRGLFRGVELVQDRETKAPFDPSHKLYAKIKQAAFEGGLICYPYTGTVEGRAGDHVMLAPPFIIGAQEVELIVTRLESAIDTALGLIS